MNLPTHWSIDDGTESIEISDTHVTSAAPLVSVVMITYNHANFIDRAIEGILGQVADFPIELIIGEDCSTDATLAVVADCRLRYPGRIRLICGERNVGPARNLFRSIEKARGRFVAFCEGDDWWCDPFKLAKQVAVMDADSRIGCVHSDFAEARLVRGEWQIFERDGVNRSRGRSEYLSGDVFSHVFTHFPVRTVTALYRKQVLDDLLASRFDHRKYTSVDGLIAGFCAASWTFGYVDDVTAIYRVSPGSMTRNGFPSMVRFLQNLRGLCDDFAAEYGHRPDFDRTAAAIVDRNLANAAFRAGDVAVFNAATVRLRQSGSLVATPGMRIRLLAMRFPLLARAIVALLDMRDDVRGHFAQLTGHR